MLQDFGKMAKVVDMGTLLKDIPRIVAKFSHIMKNPLQLYTCSSHKVHKSVKNRVINQGVK